MLIPEKYRDRYDDLARSHPWMKEMRDEQAPEGDAVAIMRECSAGAHGMATLRKRLGIECVAGWQMRCLRKLADMVERDYVNREVFEDLRDEFTWETTFLHRMGKRCGTEDVPSLVAYVDKLEAEVAECDKALESVKAERDELKAMNERLQVALDAVEGCDERCLKLEAERDELKDLQKQVMSERNHAIVERDEWKTKANCVHDYEEGVCEGNPFIKKWTCRKCGHETLFDGKAEGSSKVRACSSSAKRAAAVERLKNRVAARFDAESIVIALTGGRHGQSDWSLECDKLIDLLTDNDDCGQNADMSEKEPDYVRENGEMSDSREKLEADVREFWFPYNGMPSVHSKENVDRVIGWLDRQASITERELCKQCEWPSLAAQPDRETQDRIADLQQQVNELKASLEKAEQDRESYRCLCGQMLDAAQEIRNIADANMPEGGASLIEEE